MCRTLNLWKSRRLTLARADLPFHRITCLLYQSQRPLYGTLAIPVLEVSNCRRVRSLLVRWPSRKVNRPLVMLGRRLNCAPHIVSQPRFNNPTLSSKSCPSSRIWRAALSTSLPSRSFLRHSARYKIPTVTGLLPLARSSCSRVSRSVLYSNMSTLRSKSTKATNGDANGHKPLTNGSTAHDNDEHEHDSHSHSHSHSIFGSHSHGENGHSHGHEKIVEALQGRGE